MNATPDSDIPPPPQNKLERLMQEAATDASHYGPFFRLLRTKDVFAFLPYHPEFEEDEEVPMDRPFPMVVFGGCEEAFYPVFTSRAVAEWSLPKFSKPDARLMVVSLPAVAWFHSAAQHGRRVVINPASTLRMEMEHNAVVAWVKDQMDTPLGNHEGAERTFVRSVNFELSPEYREKVNKFCRNRRSLVAIYLLTDDLGEENRTQEVKLLRVVQWMRWNDQETYNDFGRLLSKMLPEGMELEMAAINGDDTDTLRYLQTLKPFWPETMVAVGE